MKAAFSATRNAKEWHSWCKGIFINEERIMRASKLLPNALFFNVLILLFCMGKIKSELAAEQKQLNFILLK